MSADQPATDRNTAYRRQWRKDPINKATEKARKAAERKAKTDLAHTYPDLYKVRYDHHLVIELRRMRKELGL